MQEINTALRAEFKKPDLEYTPMFYHPRLTKIKASRLSVEPLIKWVFISFEKDDKEEFGKTYNKLLQEYKPLIDWAFLCWDYLLTTQGFRYLPRKGSEKYYSHGDYRTFTVKDYKKLIFKSFKNSLFKYYQEFNFSPESETIRTGTYSFTSYLRNNFWLQIITEYQKLKFPFNKKERLLTDYSYLRCSPYHFFNRYHESRVRASLEILGPEELTVLNLYFLNFYNIESCLEEINIDLNKFLKLKNSALNKIASYDYLTYALLQQIERY